MTHISNRGPHFDVNRPVYKYEDSLMIVIGMPHIRSNAEETMPNAHALSNLLETLGAGSQAFIFATTPTLGSTRSELRFRWWREEFERELTAAGISAVGIYADSGRRDTYAGEAYVANSLFGRQRDNHCEVDCQPTDIRIYGRSAWAPQTGTDREQLCYGIRKVLGSEEGPLVFGNTSLRPNEDQPDWLYWWLRGCRVRSDHYKSVVIIEWDGIKPVIRSIKPLV